MDYEKKYKEALERAKKELQTCGSANCDAVRQIFRFFPELKESEDEFEKNRIAHCHSITEEQFKLEQDFVCNHIKKYHRQPTFLDAIEYGIKIMKDYKNKYKESLERAKELLEYMKENECFATLKDVEIIFPELRESEDISTRLKKAFGSVGKKTWGGIEVKDILNWLEKQGEKPVIWQKADEVRRHSTIQVLEYARTLPNYNQFSRDDIDKNIAWLDFLGVNSKLVEKQGEQDPILKVPTREVILAIWNLGNEWKELTHGKISTEHGTQLAYIQKHWQESDYYPETEQGEQKPANKVKPKFHEGEWVTNNACIFQISSIDDEHYWSHNDTVGSDIESVDKEYHLWTIADAKDGDVLAFSNYTIVIFKNLYNNFTFHSYCHIEEGRFNISKDDMPDWWEGKGFHPATKEQRDILFAKMKEVGYEWDAEKKELKKIEQKPAEEDSPTPSKRMNVERWKEACKAACCDVNYRSHNGLTETRDDYFVDGVLWADEHPIQKPAEWSEEDEKLREGIIRNLEYLRNIYHAEGVIKDELSERITWLESLRPNRIKL